MPIDLGNLNISIQQFQAVSRGKYNAGDVKLASDHSLERINNHVRMQNLNKVPISHDEVLAVKNAFVKALSGNGVGEEEIARVRRELGLAPDGPADKTLSERSVKPLSRQQVRRILDRNAEIINAASGPGTIRTTAQLQAGLDPNEKTRRAEKRDVVNAATDARRTLQADFDVSLVHDLLAGRTFLRTGADQGALAVMARRLKSEFLAATGGNPDATKQCVFSFRTDAGAVVELAPGCTETEFVDRLDEILLRFRIVRPIGDAARAAIDEFNALDGAQARNDWLRAQRGDAGRGAKLRNVAVAILVERGVVDWPSLAAVNRLNDREAYTLVDTLLGIARDLKGDALKRFNLLRPFLSPVLLQRPEVPLERRADIPAFSPREFNAAIGQLVSNGNDDALPRRFHRALGEVRADMSAHFGAATVPADARFSRILFEHDLQMAEDAANAENRALTEHEFRTACLDSAKRRCATEFVENAFKNVLAQNGGGKGERALAQGLMARHPDLADDLYDAGGPEAARAVLVRFADEMREMALCSATLAEFDDAAVGILVHEAFAREIGLPGVPYARNELTFVGRAAGKLAKKIGNGVLGGTIAAKTPDEIRKLFRDEAGKIARKRAEMLRKVDAMGLSPNAAALLKTHLLTTDKTDDIDLDALRAASANLAEKTARLAELLDGDAPPDDVFRQIGELAPETAKQVKALFPGQNVGSDEVSSMGTVVQLFALDAVEGLTDKVLAFFERADVKNLDFMPGTTSVLAADLRGIVSLSGSTPADLSNGLANGSLKPLFAVALAKACDDAGLANLPPAEKIARFAPEQPAGAALAQSLGALPPGLPVTPQLLQSLAAGALRQ